ELGQRRDDGAVLLLFVDASQRHLPAHLGLPLAVVFADAHRVLVQRAPRTGGKPFAVEEDARVLHEARPPLRGAVLHLPDLGVDALLPADFGELPFVVTEFARHLHDRVTVFAVGEVRAVRTATEDQLGRLLREYPLAAVPEDALPSREEERDV